MHASGGIQFINDIRSFLVVNVDAIFQVLSLAVLVLGVLVLAATVSSNTKKTIE